MQYYFEWKFMRKWKLLFLQQRNNLQISKNLCTSEKKEPQKFRFQIEMT